MKRFYLLVFVISAFAILFITIAPNSCAEEKKKKPKEVILTSTDIREDYEILGIVSVRSGEVVLDSINEKLKEEAKNLGADYVIGINYFNYSGYIYAYGTAVKIKKTETLKPEKHAF